MGEEQVQDPQLEEMLCMDKAGKQIVSDNVCSLGIWLVTIKVVMKSRMMGDYQVRLCIQQRWTYPVGASPTRTIVKVL